MSETFVAAAVRSPIGKFGGALKDVSPVDLGAHAMKAVLDKAGVRGDDLDLFIFGNVLRAGFGQLVPRQAAIKAGIPDTIDGYAVDMVCASGMQAVMNASNLIKLDDADVVLAGGFESMSQAAFTISARARWGYKTLLGAPEQVGDVMVVDGLTDPLTGEGMGIQTERLAREFEVTRDQLDQIALWSQQRAHAATQNGAFAREIAPVTLEGRKGPTVVDQDEGIRADTTAQGLASLRPAFSKDGVLTAGNSSQLSDGSSALVLASAAGVKKHSLEPQARILGAAWAAGPGYRFPEAPVPAVKRLLEKLHMKIDDFDLFENNEAYALNNVLYHELLDVPYEKLNVNGGAIALGHPLGSSGSRIIVTLLNALSQSGGKRGIASICHGTGGATAIALERV
ncbi:MAG TPA: thiolase family protein [Candidatus Eremiobacteraceae bacterium]|nr:thiolase family protein [Candidatus Eremiobacteraceae bacterium]